MCIGRTIQFLLDEKDKQLRLGVIVSANEKKYLIQVPDEVDVTDKNIELRRRWVKKKLVFFTQNKSKRKEW